MLPDEKTSVRVAVRVRPISVREKIEGETCCAYVSPTEPQVTIGTERAFTFDYAFDSDSQQEEIFTSTTQDLVDGCFLGLNATVLAYGQTGSGKTYTMGTGFDVAIPPEHLGIVPRAVDRIFSTMQAKHQESVEAQRAPPMFDILVQFIELYQDELVDLLDRAARTGRGKRGKPPRLGEDKNGGVILHNVCKKPVSSRDEILDWLKQGALARTTGSTNMNAQSSRSHAIFTIEIKQTIQQHDENDATAQFLTTQAKFHFVDLAGSERLKRTNATGERQKEGISINTCLLALGNVISKLGDQSLKATHIPYRESKLTRLLQDSLGGNSRTVMIACISPASADFMEGLTTLKYANRARNIQNKVVSNQDTTGQAISALRARILDLEMQLTEFQQGKRQPGVEAFNDMFIENNALQKENENLRSRFKQTAEEHKAVVAELVDKNHRNAELRAENDRFKEVPGGGNGDGLDFSSHQNLTDMDKMRIQYCGALEEMEAKLRKAQHELRLKNGHSNGSPGSPHQFASSSGSKTYRVASRRSISVTPGSAERLISSSAEDFMIPSIPGSPLTCSSRLDISDEDLDGVAELSELDEKIRAAEQEVESIRSQMASQRENYENKIEQLQSRISQVETERNCHLKDSRSKKGVDVEKTRERDLKYQQELDELKRQLKEQQELHNDYKRLQKDNSVHLKKMSKLVEEIATMKKARCEAIKKTEQDSKRARLRELQQTRSLSQKDKEFRAMKKRLADVSAQNIQLQHRCTRLQTDLQISRRGAKTGMSDRVAGRVGRQAIVPDEGTMKRNWDEFTKYFKAVAFKRMRLKVFEKQLASYNEELKNLRKSVIDAERNLAMSVEQQDMKSVDAWRSTLEDTRSTIHFIEQKVSEVQNEAAVCEESEDEYNNIDPVYINMKFPDEVSQRFFIANTLDLCLNQREELMLQENRAQGKAAEHAILVKERNVLREILQFYVVDSPSQAKIDIADVARKNLEENGVTDLCSEDVLRNIFATPVPLSKSSSRTKARQLTLSGPGDMLVASKSGLGSSGSSTSSTPSTFNGSSESDHASSGDNLSSSTELSPATKSMPPPRLIPTNTIRKDLKRAQEGKTVTNKGPAMVVTGYTIPSTPLRPPNRSISLMEISEQSGCALKTTPSHGNSLENVIPLANQHASPAPGRVCRHACLSHLNKVPAASPARK